MLERNPFTGDDIESGHDARALFPEGERGDKLFQQAQEHYSPRELITLRSEFNMEKGYYGEMQFYAIACASGCECVTARIDEKIQKCGEKGKTTVGFVVPRVGDTDFIVTCGEGHAEDVMSVLREQEIIEGVNLEINRNGFTLEEFNRRLELKEKAGSLRQQEGM